MKQSEGKQKYPLPYKELVEYMLKKHNIHEGIWGVYASFQFAGINAKDPSGEVQPASVAAIKEIGISPFSEESSIAFDAANLNPPKARTKKSQQPPKR
ncbi:MAG: hypothetical protein Nkreftii_002704 [Candidatus Nitrospira kreftii]|uniref:Uncharacterized protein n=1 Tax=Candidatus Nitrospira kreftii TaxID=2652173 RepID=A0A7S8FFK5_9BACT|nr:MAG: hypothetical protein Nkreftii_002704 [Candidatus Nitrospira kreftii]